MEENVSIRATTQYAQSISLELTTSLKTMIALMYSLVNNEEEQDTYIQKAGTPLRVLDQKLVSEKIYALYNRYFSISLDSSIEEYIENSFAHLMVSSAKSPCTYHFCVRKEERSYAIYVNGELSENVLNRKNILPVLQDIIRITLYKNEDFIVAFHAAVLKYKTKALILPGISGAGKSTLSSFLMFHDFSLYSDEVTVVKKNFSMDSLALCNTIKEGSWEIVNSFTASLKDKKKHLRFDNQKIKFLPPPKVDTQELSLYGATIIFPRYKKNATNTYEKLSLVEAITLIIQAQYHLYNPEDINTVQSYLEFLCSCSFYSLEYSNLEYANITIKKILSYE